MRELALANLRRGAAILRRTVLGATIALLLAVLISGFLSFGHPHGLALDGPRRYELYIDSGCLQFRRSIKTDVVQQGWNAWSIEEVGFDGSMEGDRGRWTIRTHPIGPRLTFSPWRIYQEGEVLLGGYVPEPSTGRTTPLGIWTRAW